MRRPLALLASIVALVFALASPAVASWSADSNSGSAGRVTAMTMPAGSIPTGSAAGSDVTVSWAATTSPPATGYTVRAFDALSGVERPISASCAGVVVALTCTESGVGDGRWRYTVTPRLENWVGLESSRSGPVTVETAHPTPTGLTLRNLTGGTAGVIDPEIDELSITFSEPMAVSSICSSWSDDTLNQTLSGSDVEVTVADNSGDNTLTVATSQCTLNLGSLTLGNEYLMSSTATFAGTGSHSSKATWNVATRTLTIHLGELATGTLEATPVSAATATYTPASGLVDLDGNSIVTTPLTAVNQRF